MKREMRSVKKKIGMKSEVLTQGKQVKLNIWK